MKILKYAAIGYGVLLATMVMLVVLVMASGGVETLCEAATDEAILLELVQLQRMGCPADVIMMILSYLRAQVDEPDTAPTPVELGLEFMQLRVMVEVFECDCEASEPVEPPTDPTQPAPTRPECICDYEFDRVEEYNTVSDIMRYLAIVSTDEPLAAGNLQQRGEQAATARCNDSPADDKATAVFQPSTYTSGQMISTIERCGIGKPKDARGILDLHLEGAFIEFLSKLSRDMGYSEDDYIGRYPVPAEGGITCPFGWRVHPITNKPNMHKGIDIGTAWHTPIMSIADGTVVGRGTDKYDGRYILVRHDNDVQFYSYYAHLSDWRVRAGDRVTVGQVVGIEGGDPDNDPEPGYSTGHHLHFEIRMSEQGGQVNPLAYLKRPASKEEDNED